MGRARRTSCLLLLLVCLSGFSPGPEPELAKQAGELVVSRARERARALARRGRWTAGEVQSLVALQLGDPERFVSDDGFRRRILDLLPRMLDPGTPAGLRDAILQELDQIKGFDFAASDQVARSWGALPRSAAERQVPYNSADQRAHVVIAGRLAASVYSLPSFFFDLATVEAFLSAVHAAAPERILLVLTDGPILAGLTPRAKALNLRLLNTFGRPYSPWPRDAFRLLHGRDGRALVIVRPNLQPGREEDANLGPELVRSLPEDLDGAWGRLSWMRAPVPFHNGQMVFTGGTAWVSLHSLETRILEILGLDRIPVESFATPEGIDRYLAAADQAAREEGDLYGRAVRFVHPLPRAGAGDLAVRQDLMRRIGGGAGFDLDSVVTLVPRRDGRTAALVGDVAAGRDLLARSSPADLEALRRGFGLEPAGLAAALAEAQRAPRMSSLEEFLDLTARHLAAQGMEVKRLPILAVPIALLQDRSGLSHSEFLLTWNNVVVETRADGIHAEGFSYLLPDGDEAARAAFSSLGIQLDLFPPLPRSIILNGGYRCASNQLRL
jgi:hypothetical protein